MWWFFFILFFIVSLFSSVCLFYALRRLNNYEEVILDIQSIIDYSSEKLKIIDNKGSFEADDEVGFVFQELKSIQGSLDTLFEMQTENTDGEEGQKTQ